MAVSRPYDLRAPQAEVPVIDDKSLTSSNISQWFFKFDYDITVSIIAAHS